MNHRYEVDINVNVNSGGVLAVAIAGVLVYLGYDLVKSGRVKRARFGDSEFIFEEHPGGYGGSPGQNATSGVKRTTPVLTAYREQNQ